MVQRIPSALQIPYEHWIRILILLVARILSLVPSVSCYWHRRHRTLWRQWWIWPLSHSPQLWNLTTVRVSITAKILCTNSVVLCW